MLIFTLVALFLSFLFFIISIRLDELPVDDDAVHQAGDVRVQHVVREDAVGKHVLVRRRSGCRLRLHCHGQAYGQDERKQLPETGHDCSPGGSIRLLSAHYAPAVRHTEPQAGTGAVRRFVYTPVR